MEDRKQKPAFLRTRRLDFACPEQGVALCHAKRNRQANGTRSENPLLRPSTKVTNTTQTIEVQPLSGFKKALAYLVDEKLAPLIQLGSLVKIPLGHRKTLGIVSSLAPESTPPSVEKLKFVLSLVRDDPVLSPDLISLARWMSGYYATSIESVLEGMIPAAVRDGMGEKTQRMIESTPLGSTEKGKQLVIRSPKQRLLLDHLIKKAGPVQLNETIKTLGVGQSVAKGLVEKGLARESKDAVMRVAYGDDLMDSGDQVYAEVELTDEQSKASSEIKESLKTNRFSTHLLLGITGSGKTEVYFEVMEEALSTGGAFCFWFPKSLLAPQTVSRLRHRFSRLGEQVVVWHSHLSAGERLDAWSSITQGDAKIVVGARSAVFAPVSNLRLVVVDEEHEPAYKQDESPRYHGRDVRRLSGYAKRRRLRAWFGHALIGDAS